MIHGVGAGDVIQGKVASSPQHEGFGMEYRLFLRRLVDAYTGDAVRFSGGTSNTRQGSPTRSSKLSRLFRA